MSTFVAGPLVRPVGLDSFFDITGPDVPVLSFDGGVTFDADLTPAQVDAIRARMTSRDDADQAARADLAAKRDTAAAADLSTTDGLEALRAAVLAGLNYTLGDS